MNHHTPTLGTWNNILLRAVGSACIWLQVDEDHSLNTHHPEGGKKKNTDTHSAFWMIPRMRDCDSFQQGRQSGRQKHTLSFLTLCVLHERGRGTSLFLSRWMQRIMWLFSSYLSKLCSLSLISRLSPTNTSLHFSDLSPSLESQSLHLCSDLSYLGDSQNKLYTQKQQLEKL